MVTPNLPVSILHNNNAVVSNVNDAALPTSESNLPRMLLKQQKSHIGAGSNQTEFYTNDDPVSLWPKYLVTYPQYYLLSLFSGTINLLMAKIDMGLEGRSY